MEDLKVNNTTTLKPNQSTGNSASINSNGGSFEFKNFLDLINPLQHIPGVGTIYRAVTGDTITDETRFIGHIVYAGPFGLVAAAAETLATDNDGRRLSENLALWWGEEAETAKVAGQHDAPDRSTSSADSPATKESATGPALVQVLQSNAQYSVVSNAAAPIDLQQVKGNLLDNFIQRHKNDQTAAFETIGKTEATHLSPPLSTENMDGVQLAQWMMKALDRYRQQASQQ